MTEMKTVNYDVNGDGLLDHVTFGWRETGSGGYDYVTKVEIASKGEKGTDVYTKIEDLKDFTFYGHKFSVGQSVDCSGSAKGSKIEGFQVLRRPTLVVNEQTRQSSIKMSLQLYLQVEGEKFPTRLNRKTDVVDTRDVKGGHDFYRVRHGTNERWVEVATKGDKGQEVFVKVEDAKDLNFYGQKFAVGQKISCLRGKEGCTITGFEGLERAALVLDEQKTQQCSVWTSTQLYLKLDGEEFPVRLSRVQDIVNDQFFTNYWEKDEGPDYAQMIP